MDIESNTYIGIVGFEPTTPWSQTRYSTKLSYIPFLKIIITNDSIINSEIC